MFSSLRSLYGRTVILLAAALIVFSLIIWQAIAWAAIPTVAQLSAQMLATRAVAANEARGRGAVLPDGTRFESTLPHAMSAHTDWFALGAYVNLVADKLRAKYGFAEVRISRFGGPAEIWLKTKPASDQWLVINWRLAPPAAPFIAIGILIAAAVLVLGMAALATRRLTAPLTELADAAARIAVGERVEVRPTGPAEVQYLARAFSAMSERLQQLDEQRELMLAGLSHDLRTPLARISAATALLDARDREITDEIDTDVAEIDCMVGQFLQYVRANYRESLSAACADDIARAVIERIATASPIDMRLGAAEGRLFAVETVRHILLNLIQNALEYGAEPITVTTELTALELRLIIADCGEGLSPAQWRDAVQPFRRLRRQPGVGHSGLGLAMVERLVTRAGGRLGAAQRAGSFSITAELPALMINDSSAATVQS